MTPDSRYPAFESLYIGMGLGHRHKAALPHLAGSYSE